MSCPAVASENGTTLVRVRRKNQSNYSSLVLFGVTVKNYTEHGFSALASLIIVGFSPLSVKRIYARARRIHSVSSRSIPGHGGSTQCEADLRPGTVDPLSVKQIYALAQWIHSVSSRSTPGHGVPAPIPQTGCTCGTEFLPFIICNGSSNFGRHWLLQ